MRDLGAIGSDGEYYFHPSKVAKLKGPNGVLIGKPKVIPIFPFNNVLVPLGKELLNLLEMRHRQLFSDVGDGVFGFTYYSQQQQKLALVGTLARVTERKVMEDGRCVVVIEGIERFFIQDLISEKPYIKARVQTFTDYTESVNDLQRLELAVFDEVRTNAKVC
jgi:Lon protease-like protein